MSTPRHGAPLVIASNRGPVDYELMPDGSIASRRGDGGLINVLGPALANGAGVWVASVRTEGDRLMARRAADSGVLSTVDLPEGRVALRGVDLEPQVYDAYYASVGTETLWFLHHQLFDPMVAPGFGAAFRADWQAYEQVNDRFAAACAEEAETGAVVLLQDYHLAVAPALLRARRADLRIAHFTMCPWADPGYFRMLPEETARALIDGMLGADVLAFLAPRWAKNFLRCCTELGYEADPRGGRVCHRAGVTAVRVYPVGVDVPALRARAAGPQAQAERRRLDQIIGGKRLVARVERMEPAKNAVRGVMAFDEYLAAHPEQAGQVVHYVLAYASRAGLPGYQRYAAEVHAAVAAVNARYGTADWTPVVLDTVNNLDRGLALMARADVLVVNSLRDGMNLVAKEGPAVSERAGVVILSQEAGAADEMQGSALLVNPFDIHQLTTAIETATAMPQPERQRRLNAMRVAAGALPPKRWLTAVLADLRPAAVPAAVGG